MNYFLARGGQQFGPYSEEQLRTMASQAALSPNDLLWRDGMATWTPAGAILGMTGASAPAIPPPIPGSVVPVNGYPVYPSSGPAAAYAAPKSRAVFIVLAVFLGLLGIHNFYAGFTGRGLAQLLITVLVGWLVVPLIAVAIWLLAEIIAVTADSRGVAFV